MAKRENTQRDIILNHLYDRGHITTFEAFTEYGFTRLSAIIYNLRQEGYNITDEWITRKNRYNNPIAFKKYILEDYNA